jgi:acetylornithine deacetylase
MLSRVLEHLDALVSFDTRNPPRAIGTDGIFDYLCEALPGFRIELNDHGAGAVSLLAVRGETSRIACGWLQIESSGWVLAISKVQRRVC